MFSVNNIAGTVLKTTSASPKAVARDEICRVEAPISVALASCARFLAHTIVLAHRRVRRVPLVSPPTRPNPTTTALHPWIVMGISSMAI